MADQNFPLSPTGQPAMGALNAAGETTPVSPTDPMPIPGLDTENDHVAIGADALVNGLAVDREAALGLTVNIVKASEGRLYGLDVFNAGGAVAYLQVFDAPSGVVLGTTIPMLTIPIPAGAPLNRTYNPPIECLTGISMASTAAADGSGAAAAVLCNALYR
jgi:hypothetical protein